MSGFMRDRRGAALVEFAIVVVLLMTLVFGIIEFGLLIKNYLAGQHGAREGARVAIVGATTSEIDSRVRESCPTTEVEQVVMDKKKPNSEVWEQLGNTDGNTGPKNDAEPGDHVRVTVKIKHEWITWFFSSSTTSFDAQTIMRRD